MDVNALLQQSPVSWQTILDEIIETFGCSTGTIHRLDVSTNLLHLVAQKGIPDFLLSVVGTIPVGKGIAGAAAATLAPVEICNLQSNDGGGIAKPGAKHTQVEGSIAVPVMNGETLTGTLGIGKLVPYSFTEEEKTQLLDIASAIASHLPSAP